MVIHVSGEERICWMSEWMVLFPLSVGPLCTIYVYLAVSESVTAVELSWRPDTQTSNTHIQNVLWRAKWLSGECVCRCVRACMRLCAWQLAAAGIFYFDSFASFVQPNRTDMPCMQRRLCVRVMDVAVDVVVSVCVCHKSFYDEFLKTHELAW